MSLFLGIDGGGTKSDVLLIDASGRVLASHREGSAYYPQIGVGALQTLIEQGIRATLTQAAVRPADVRGILARADDLGLKLVGDVDGDVLDRMRDARTEAAGGDAPAYAVLRLTFRRR